MASSGDGDVPVTLWTFRVERNFKGVTGADVVVVAYDTDALVSRDVPTITAGAQAVLFLTEEVHGARVIVAGEQGMLAVDDGGKLKASSPAGSFLDARDEATLSRAIQ